MKDIDNIYKKLSEIEQNFGIGVVILIIAFGTCLFFFWKYLINAIELKAQEGFAKEMTKFNTKHGKQVDAIHECYNRFEKLSSFINYMMNGDRYLEPIDVKKQMQLFLKFRQEFKDKFNEQRIVFSTKTCEKIDLLFPVIDQYFETFNSGITPMTEEDKQRNAEENGGVYIAGIWPSNTFEPIIKQIEEVKNDIEAEFRKIYGTE
ncbi:hypothetical protein [Tenacibaculum discolor]|uniref:hypothetical protein n=1 Tax=Tenacibaculum discolor TaxID=361581 RepID=UPI000F5A6E7B|nr:hypothetical protein [Tenacibaculum discolor]